MRRKILHAAAPLAVLLLVPILFIAFHALHKRSTGLLVRIARNTCDCYPIDRTVVLHVSSECGLSLNSEPVDAGNLASRTSNIYATRAERILYFSAAADVPFECVAEVMDTIENSRTKVLPGGLPLPAELEVGVPESLNIEVRLVTPGAVNTSCPKGCYNWGKEGLLVTPSYSRLLR